MNAKAIAVLTDSTLTRPFDYIITIQKLCSRSRNVALQPFYCTVNLRLFAALGKQNGDDVISGGSWPKTHRHAGNASPKSPPTRLWQIDNSPVKTQANVNNQIQPLRHHSATQSQFLSRIWPIMSKLPVSALSHSKPNTTSWTRLVQTTKTASKTPRHGDTKSPSLRRHSSQTSTASLSGSPRPMKRRRIAGPKSQSAPNSAKKLPSLAAVSGHDPELAENLTRAPATTTVHAKRSIRAGSEHVETCASSKEEPHSSDREYDSPQPSKPESALTGVPSSSPTYSDLRAFWGPFKEGRRSRQNEASHKIDELTDWGAVLQQEMSESAHRDITDTTSKVVTKLNVSAPVEVVLATNAMVTRSGRASNALRRSSRTGQRSKLEHETSRLDNENEQKGHAVNTDQRIQNAVDSHTEDSHTVRNLSGTLSAASTPGLHDNTSKASLNSLPESDQITTHTSPQSPASGPDDKENGIPTRKAKRRLTLHDIQSHHPQNKKKRKAAPKQTVQTTLALAIGGNAGMRECKVCDTVYNPLHPEDVKVHAKRHAGVVRKERKHIKV